MLLGICRLYIVKVILKLSGGYLGDIWEPSWGYLGNIWGISIASLVTFYLHFMLKIIYWNWAILQVTAICSVFRLPWSHVSFKRAFFLHRKGLTELSSKISELLLNISAAWKQHWNSAKQVQGCVARWLLECLSLHLTCLNTALLTGCQQAPVFSGISIRDRTGFCKILGFFGTGFT